MTQPKKAPKKPGVIKRMLLAAAGYYGGVATHIASQDESYGLFMQNDGSVEVRHNGSHVRDL